MPLPLAIGIRILQCDQFSVPMQEGLSVSISLPTRTDNHPLSPFGHEVNSYSDFCFDFIFSKEFGGAVKYLLACWSSVTICPQHFVLSLFCFIFLITLEHFEIRYLDILLCSLYLDEVVYVKVTLAFP